MTRKLLFPTILLLLGAGIISFFIAGTEEVEESSGTPFESAEALPSDNERVVAQPRVSREWASPAPVSSRHQLGSRNAGPVNLSGVDLDLIPYGVQRVDEVLFERVDAPDDRGLVRRTRVLATDFHYPNVQTVELLERDSAGGEDKVVAYKAMVADHVMAQIDFGRSPSGWANRLEQAGIGLRREVTRDGLYLMEFPLDRAGRAFEVIEFLQAQGDWIRFAEPDMLITKLAEDEDTIPNDPFFEDQWGLHNTGQEGEPEFILPEIFRDLLPDFFFEVQTGIPGFDINAIEGWNTRTDASDVIVAVLDTGIDFNHYDIKANMWRNPAERPNTGQDDSGSGFIDDIFGVDVVTGGPPMDFDGHGTHVAGTIGAIGDNQLGVTGVAWEVQLMAVKILSPGGTVSDIIRGIDYAWENGAHILNNSWGILLNNARLFGHWRSQALADAILRTRHAGAIFVTAAGNDATDVDIFPDFPAHHQAQSDNVVNVAAFDRRGLLTGFSNFGTRNVQVAAPGHQIWSTWLFGGYNSISGTSMAAPHVSGMLALMKAEFPNEPYNVLIERLLQRSSNDSQLADFVEGGRRVDLAAALDPSPLIYSPLRDISFMPDFEDSLTLSVGASGKGTLSYKWFHNEVEIPGAEEPTYEIASPGSGAAGHYRVEVRNAFGEASSEAHLRLSIGDPDLADALAKDGDDSNLNWFTSGDAPWTAVVRDGGPTARSGEIDHNENSELTVSVAGPGTLSFSMRTSSEANRDKLEFLINGEVMETVSGESAVWLNRTRDLPQGDHELTWRYSKDGSVSHGDDAAWLRNVTYVPNHPVIDSITSSGDYAAGSDLTLTVEARGSDLGYYWEKDGVLIEDENEPVLELTDLGASDAGNYRVTVFNSFGAVSRSATVSVVNQMSAPIILSQPQSVVSGLEGEPVVLWAEFQATLPWQVQWYKDGEALPGETGSYLNLGGLTPERQGVYSYTVTNPAGSAESMPVQVTLASPAATYSNWLAEFDGHEAVETASGDGVHPALRYALGLAPGEPATHRLPRLVLIPESEASFTNVAAEPMGQGSERQYLGLIFERKTSTKGVSYILEASTDLNDWEEVDSLVEVIDLSGGENQLVQLREAVPVSTDEGRRFLRMRVEIDE